MTRRTLMVGLAATPLAWSRPSLMDLWNEFAAAVREWIRQREALTVGESPLPSQRYWREHVRTAFHEVDLVVREE